MKIRFFLKKAHGFKEVFSSETRRLYFEHKKCKSALVNMNIYLSKKEKSEISKRDISSLIELRRSVTRDLEKAGDKRFIDFTTNFTTLLFK